MAYGNHSSRGNKSLLLRSNEFSIPAEQAAATLASQENSLLLTPAAQVNPPPAPDIPGLPPPSPDMNWRQLSQFGPADRGEAFYVACLQYAQELWRQRLPARAILCLDRAWGADLRGGEHALADWPLPYLPLVHILRHAPPEVFLGNPRVHFQHYADRLGEPRRDTRKWRAWAGWAIACRARPDLPPDPLHEVIEPTLEEVGAGLRAHGLPGEVELWRAALATC